MHGNCVPVLSHGTGVFSIAVKRYHDRSNSGKKSFNWGLAQFQRVEFITVRNTGAGSQGTGAGAKSSLTSHPQAGGREGGGGGEEREDKSKRADW